MTRKYDLKFKPKAVVKRLVVVLPDRARDVVTARFGIGDVSERQTLESIGSRYNITRERVRQIENHSINQIRKSESYDNEVEAFGELEKIILELGSIVIEEELLEVLGKNKQEQNEIYFLLHLADNFNRVKENNDFKHHWHVDDGVYESVREALQNVYKGMTKKDLIAEEDMIQQFLDHLKDVAEEYRNEEVARRWLRISKKVSRNPLGEWGHSNNPSVRVKGIRDYAFLVIRRHGSPMHFTEVAENISEVFGKKAHVATTHNELIKDKRFVLVGRGLYALKDWGYISGVVKDVIKKIIDKHGPLTREEIIDKVLRERYVKENTIMVNLQDQKHFIKDKDGRYSIVEN